jgi:serine/threonine-protein kinase
MHIYEPPPRLSTFAPHLPPDLDALVAKLLVKNPGDRTPSAAYTLAALERIALPPLAGEVMLRGERLPTDSPAAEIPTVMLPVMLPDIPPLPAQSRMVPVAVLLIALAIAAAAVVVIGFS